MSFISGQGIYLSAYVGASPDQLTAADTAAVALSSAAPIIFVDTNFTLGMNYTLSSTLVAVGGILTTGAHNLTCPFARGNVPLFDRGGTGVITFTAPVDWIEGILFNPALDGMTDCISDFNRWVASCSLDGAMFHWPRGTYHTAYTNKFVFPTNPNAAIDATGAVLDSTFVYEGQFQKYIGCPTVGGQVILTMSGGTFTVGGQVKQGTTYKSGIVQAWNGTSKQLTLGCFVPLHGASLQPMKSLTDVQTGMSGTINTITYQVPCGSETGNSGGGSTNSFVQYSTYAPCLVSSCWMGHTAGITGANLSGSFSFTRQTSLSGQNCIFSDWEATTNGNYGVCLDGSGPGGTFFNGMTYIGMSSSLNGTQGFVLNACNQNQFIRLDLENNSGNLISVFNGLENTCIGGTQDTTVVGAKGLNYTSLANRHKIFGMFFNNGTPVTELVQTITGISNATTAVISFNATTPPAVGDFVSIDKVTGMTQINNLYTVASVTFSSGSGTLTLKDIFGVIVDSSGFGTYGSGGTVSQGMPIVGLGNQGSQSTGLNSLNDVDEITTTDVFASGHTFLPASGLSDGTATFTLGSGGTTGHTLSFDTSGFGTANTGAVRITASVYNTFSSAHLGGFSFTCIFWRANSGTLNIAAPSVTGLGLGNVTITSIAASSANIVVTFNTSTSVANCFSQINYGDRNATDLG